MDLKTLLKKYMSGKIRAEEFKQLQDSTRNLSDKELGLSLEALWIESEMKTMNPEAKKQVRETLRQQLVVTARKNLLNWRNVAVAVFLPLLTLSAAYIFTSLRQPVAQEFVVKSAKGQKTQVDLPDGTKVWLNSASQISYNSKFNQKNRRISLNGEAFFDVKESATSMFIVDVGGVSVNVHGTAFNVTAYEEDSLVFVSLNRGKIDVVDSGDQHIIASLFPDQQVVVNRKDLLSKLTECDAELNSLWIQNRLKMEDVSSEELFKNMEHWYGVSIHVGNINPEDFYSLTIKTESLREMLDLINRMTPISYEINGEEVNVLYKK